MQKNTKNKIIKLCIVGDRSVGKTTILHRYVNNLFIEDTLLTIGANFFIKRVNLEDENVTITLQIWDLGGQDRFYLVRPNFYKGAQGVIYTFDLTRRLTFLNLKKWNMEIERVINHVPSIVFGNKLDLVKNTRYREVSKKEGKSLLDELNAFAYFETSAKDGTGIFKAFELLNKRVYKFSLKNTPQVSK